jgi:hypothetical protein
LFCLFFCSPIRSKGPDGDSDPRAAAAAALLGLAGAGGARLWVAA